MGAIGAVSEIIGAAGVIASKLYLAVQGRKDLTSLASEDDYQRFGNLALQGCSHFSATYFQYQQGLLNDSDWFESRAVI